MSFAGDITIPRNIDTYKNVARFAEMDFIRTGSNVNKEEATAALVESEKNLNLLLVSKQNFVLKQFDKLKLVESNLLVYKANLANYLWLLAKSFNFKTKLTGTETKYFRV